jgi:hypothetical protein
MIVLNDAVLHAPRTSQNMYRYDYVLVTLPCEVADILCINEMVNVK